MNRYGVNRLKCIGGKAPSGGSLSPVAQKRSPAYRIADTYGSELRIVRLSANADRSDRDSIQVIARAAAVLRIVADHPGGLSLTGIARLSGLARSTIQRIVKSLEEERFLEPASSRGGVMLGRDLLQLSRRAGIDVLETARPLLRQLAADVDETVDLSILHGKSASFIEHIAGSHRLAALSAIGTEFPLHSTANGKALLGCLSQDQRRAMLGTSLHGDTSRTITNLDELDAQLAQFSRHGIAYDREEHTEGVCAVGTAFVDAVGCAYAISIPLPRQRFDVKEKLLEGPLLRCRDEIVAMVKGSIPG